MKVLCLTGGIASGKSTVARMFEAKGIPLIDTDSLARDVLVDDKEAINQVLSLFEGVGTKDGSIDRKALAKRIFDDPEAREKLNAIVHPRVRSRMHARIEELTREGHRLVLVDVPLLYEAKFDDACQWTITVHVDKATQVERLLKRDGIDKDYALKKIEAQMPLDEKAERSDVVIDNSKDLAHTESQVESILKKVGDA
ncbi:MAG: dephospho-CoA kinase [Bacillota bacterium]